METTAAVQASCSGGIPLDLATSPEGEAFIVAITDETQGKTRVVALEAVLQTDLSPHRDATWWLAVRTGRLAPDLNRMTMRLIPGRPQEGCLVDGFTLQLCDGTHTYAQRFNVHHLSQTAGRATARLLQQGKLEAEAEVHYFLVCQPLSDRARQKVRALEQGRQMGQIRAVRRYESLHFEEASLSHYLAGSRPLVAGQAVEPRAAGPLGPMPVFFRQDVWAAGHAFSRRGNDLESAAVWTGRLLRDTESPEVFVVVDACVDARYAEEGKYSVTFSGETWSRVRQVLAQRRRRLNRPHEIILGSVHGHNFTPGTREEGGRLCDACPDLPTCRKTTAVLSTDDLDWHHSVFTAQPYALLALWGWTARKEEVWQCYSLSGSTLTSRPIRVLTNSP